MSLSHLVFLSLVLGFSPMLSADTPAAIFGTWEFTSIRYQGQVRPRPNPDLVLRFEFFGDGTNRLHWTRIGERGFCERKARFTVQNGLLIQEVFWVNPNNGADCGRDPDMQMGSKSQTPLHLTQDTLETELNLGDETLTYIWTRVP
ncbi:MAG: hypothetical protein ACK5P7_11350 [Bdellovibrio sp.]